MVPAVNDALFPLEATPDSSPVKEEGRAPVAKTFRPYDPQQILLLPPSLDEWLPEGHLARFVSELVEEALDLSAIRAAYVEERGYPRYDPRLPAIAAKQARVVVKAELLHHLQAGAVPRSAPGRRAPNRPVPRDALEDVVRPVQRGSHLLDRQRADIFVAESDAPSPQADPARQLAQQEWHRGMFFRKSCDAVDRPKALGRSPSQ